MLSEILSERAKGPHTALATEVGVHQTTISAWARGAHLPPRTRIPALARALSMPVEELAAIVEKDKSAKRTPGNEQGEA